MVLVSTSTDYREQSKMLQCSLSSTWVLLGNFVWFCFMVIEITVQTSPFCRMYITEREKGLVTGDFELSSYLGCGVLIKYRN